MNADWNKLQRLMVFLKSTRDECLKLSIDDTHTARWYIDAAYAVHPDMRSHTGAFLTLGRGAFISSSGKQKINTRSSTEAELIGVDDLISTVIWTKLFLEEQGMKLKTTIIFQDNTSAMQLENKGLMSTGRRSRHLNIKYFFITDMIKRNEVQVQYCATANMIADYFTKPLQGSTFKRFRTGILNLY